MFGACFMNWLVIAVVGAAAAWFEYNYQRSRHPKKSSAGKAPNTSALRVPETAHVEQMGEAPSILPGAENDEKLNTPA
jgi:hypothetical protein